MAENKKSFLLYSDIIHTVKKLPDEKAGQLLKHILAYVNDENPETDDIIIQIAFEPIKQSLKRDLKKWEDNSPARVEKARTAGLASAKARQLKSTQSNSLVENELGPTNSTVSVSVSDSVTVSEKTNYQKLLLKVIDENEISLPAGFEPLILEWLKYKSEKGQSYKETGLKTLIRTFLRDSNSNIDIGRGMLDYSMSKNYAGLFKEKSNENNSGNNKRSVKRINEQWNS